MNTWFTHFKNLIGNHPSTDENKDIPAIFSDLDINDGPFTHSEFVKVKRSLKEEVDGIPLEVLKNCDLDNIALYLCNHA